MQAAVPLLQTLCLPQCKVSPHARLWLLTLVSAHCLPSSAGTKYLQCCEVAQPQRSFCVLFPPFQPEALLEKGTQVSLSPDGLVSTCSRARQRLSPPPPIVVAYRGPVGSPKPCWTHVVWACRALRSTSEWCLGDVQAAVWGLAWVQHDRSGARAGTASCQPPWERAGCPSAMLTSPAKTQRLAQAGCGLGLWGLIVLTPCKSNKRRKKEWALSSVQKKS